MQGAGERKNNPPKSVFNILRNMRRYYCGAAELFDVF